MKLDIAISEEENPICERQDMSGWARFAVCAAIFAVVFTAMMFNTFFKFKPMGVNVPLSTAALYVALFCAYRGRISLKLNANWLLLPFIAAFSLVFLIYNNSFLLFLDMVMLIGLIGIQLCLMTGQERPRLFGGRFLANAGVQLFVRPFARIGGIFSCVFAGNGKNKTVGGILIGLAVLIPILVLLLVLLTSADMIFGEMVKKVISWDTVWNSLLAVFMFSSVFALTGSALISGSLKNDGGEQPQEKKRAHFSLPAVFIIVGALTAVLLVFGWVQVMYLARIKFMPYGFSYSDYARQGFFQLCGAAALVFIVLAVCLRFTAHAEGGVRTALNVLFTVLAVSVLMLLISAFWRMALYEQEYLYTRLRIYTQAFMILLAVVTAIAAVKIWRRRTRIFKAVFYAVTVGMLALTFFNADGFIASQAVSSYERGGKEPDYEYLLSLSSDALPYYARYLTPEIFEKKELKEPDEYFGYTGDQTQEQWDEYYQYSSEIEKDNRKKERLFNDLKDMQQSCRYRDIRSYNILRYQANGSFELENVNKILDNG